MNSGFCRCGCGNKTSIATRNRYVRGQVKGQPVPFIHGHQSTIPLFQRVADFWKRTKLIPEFGWPDCIEWAGSLMWNGYGVNTVSIFGNRSAHRIAYTLTFGLIPKGLEPDHLCRNRRCINPYHLELVTRKINSRRGAMAKLTETLAAEILASSEPTRILMKKYNVSRSTIKGVRSGRTWS